jgi:diadenosine tetraphosphate (Ap4A) HIT family hydrolase
MPENTFTLHPQLEADSFFLRSLALCQVRLMNRKTVPWLLLVPQKIAIRELHDLTSADRAVLVEEIANVSRALDQLYAPDKINIGMLGNIVPQFHVHIIARFKSDPLWPDPVWGRVEPEPYTAAAIKEIKVKLSRETFLP